MKKTIKRLGAIFLAMAMAVSVLCTGALASDFTINITSKTSGHTYEAYQVFTGTLDNTKKILSDIQWGSAISDKSSNFLTALQGDTAIGSDFNDKTTAAEVAEVLATYKDENDNKAKAFAAVVGKFIDAQNKSGTTISPAPVATTNISTTETNNGTTVYKYTLDVQAAGYYFVKDKNDSVKDPNSATEYILRVVGPTSTDSKDGTVPTVDKTVNSKPADTANIGDKVNFELTGTLPDNYDSYTTYRYIFHDTLDKGLTYNADAKVYVKNGETETEITTGYTVNPANGTTSTGNTITVTFDDLKKVTGATIDKDSEIIVKYSATLNENANIGTVGNSNKVKLEYSNDPNKEGTGATTEKEVKVYTFQLNVDKVDDKEKDGNSAYTKHLSGAEFKLYRINNEKTEYAKVENSKLTGWTETETDEHTTLTTDAQGKIEIAGLKDGTYYLKETKAPDGYNLPTGDSAITTITIKATEPLDGTLSEDGKSDNVTITKTTEGKTTGTATVTITNNAGSTLPSTGGMGTTLFYIVGGALMAGAAIVLVIKKKRSSAE